MNTHQKKYLAQNVIGGTDVEAETPILWPPDTERWCIWKDPDAGKDWGQEEKRMTEDGITDTMGRGLGGLRELVMDREASHAVIDGVAKSQTRLSDWTELNWTEKHGNVPVRNWKLPLFHISLWIPLELVVMLSSIYLWFVCVCVCVCVCIFQIHTLIFVPSSQLFHGFSLGLCCLLSQGLTWET